MNKLAVILIPLTIILFSFTIVLKDVNFYKSEMIKNKVAQNLNLTESAGEKLNSEITNIISYLTGKKDKLESSFFGEQETIHMVDVKNIISKVITAGYILMGIVFLLIIFSKEKLRTLKIAGITSLIFYIILSLILLNFDYFFLKFHELFFSNKLWIFSADSPIINIFPQQFFIDFFQQILIYSFLIAIGLIVISFVLSIFKKKEDLKTT